MQIQLLSCDIIYFNLIVQILTSPPRTHTSSGSQWVHSDPAGTLWKFNIIYQLKAKMAQNKILNNILVMTYVAVENRLDFIVPLYLTRASGRIIHMISLICLQDSSDYLSYWCVASTS